MSPDIRSARVIDVLQKANGETEAVLAVGAEERLVPWKGETPARGDLFRTVDGAAPGPQDKIGSSEPDGWRADSDALRWRKRGADGLTRMELLRRRHIVRRAVRDYMDGEGFIEIDTPLLVHGTTPDTAIDSFRLGDRFLVTSAEYQIKRMEIGGFDKTYTLTQNYRLGDDTSPCRNPEFTMIEWARVGDTLARIEADAEQMTWCAHRALGGGDVLDYQGHRIRLAPPWRRMSIAQAVETYVGVALPDFSLASILKAVQKAGLAVKPEWREDRPLLFTLLMDHIQPFLGFEQPVFLCDWPSFQTSSASGKDGGDIAERSELFIAGIEISDGFPTLTNYRVQVEAFAQQLERRQQMGLPEALLDEAYLKAMKVGIPSGAGMALGFDRLVMLLTGQTEIRRVLAFAWDEA